MGLRRTLRKAAELLVELPPEEPEASTEPISADAPARSSGGSATDAMWAELEREAQQRPPAASPAPTKTVEQIVKEAAGPNLDEIKVAPDTLPQAVRPDGTMDFAAIYQAASLPAVPFTCEQVLEMMAALPSDLPLETRRQTVRVSISAMGKSIGASPENIVADASRKLAALAAYADHLTKLSNEYVAAAEQKIAQLEAQIAEMRKGIEAAKQKATGESAFCAAESDRLDDVLEFFSLDVPPSKYAP